MSNGIPQPQTYGMSAGAVSTKRRHRVWDWYRAFHYASHNPDGSVSIQADTTVPGVSEMWVLPPEFVKKWKFKPAELAMETAYDEIINPIKPIDKAAAAVTKCFAHQWKKYVGFTQTYDYCERCDAKRTEKA